MVATLRMKNENYSSYEQGKMHSSFFILHSSFRILHSERSDCSSFPKKFVNQVLAMESS